MQRLQSWLLAILIFVWPSNLFLKFAEPTGYVHGLLVDYLLPKLYLSDLVIFALLVSWGVEYLSKRNVKLKAPFYVGVALFILLGVAQLFTAPRLTTWWFLLKLVELSLLAGWIGTHWQLFRSRIIWMSLLCMLAFQSVVGLTQYVRQSSAFPSYEWLGETRLDKRAGLARGTWNGVTYLLPYGTTSHPNILAGVLSVGLLIVWSSSMKEKKLRWGVVIVSAGALLTLLLTQSWSAMLALGGGCIAIYCLKKLKKCACILPLRTSLWSGAALFFLLAPLFTFALAKNSLDPSFTRRAFLNTAATQMFIDSPVVGKGLNTFTVHLEDVSRDREAVRFVQPAHHVGLLLLAEVGLVGVLGLTLVTAALIWQLTATQKQQLKSVFPYILIIFVPLLSLDHYLFTQQIGQLISVIGGSWLLSNFMDLEKD